MIFKTLFISTFLSHIFTSVGWANSKKIVTTVPALAWLINEILDEEIAKSLLMGHEDPHYVDASPAYIRKVAAADLVCIVGMGLEDGYMPAVIRKASYKGPDCTPQITALDVPQAPMDRSMGHVHASGNPHYYLSPVRLEEAGLSLIPVLANLGLHPKDNQWRQTLKKITRRTKDILKPVQKTLIMEYHQEFRYFFEDYGLMSFGSLEEKPGVLPSAGRLAAVATEAKKSGVKLLVTARLNSRIQKFASISQIPYVVIPAMTQDQDVGQTQRLIAQSLVDALK